MGQQQLLLVILVTIIVGIATVVAINIFGTSAENANADAVRQDLASIATAAEGWYMKPGMLGGGDRTYEGLSFNQIAFPADNISANGLIATNANGVYTITAPGDETGPGATFTVTAVPASFPQDIEMVVLRVVSPDGRERPEVDITVVVPAS